MSTHATHDMHANSLLAWATLDTKGRSSAIFDVYRNSIQPLTDREVMERLGFTDGNCVKPRISELIDKGKLAEVGKAKDRITGKTVRVCTNVVLTL